MSVRAAIHRVLATVFFINHLNFKNMWDSVQYALPICEIELSKKIKHYRSKNCIVLIKGKTPEIAYYNTCQFSDDEEPWFSWFCPQADDIVDNVTHWMFVPELPC